MEEEWVTLRHLKARQLNSFHVQLGQHMLHAAVVLNLTLKSDANV